MTTNKKAVPPKAAKPRPEWSDNVYDPAEEERKEKEEELKR